MGLDDMRPEMLFQVVVKDGNKNKQGHERSAKLTYSSSLRLSESKGSETIG
jgi:hypothetical protein